MKLNGTIVKIEDEVQMKDFRRRSFVIETSDKGYSNFITFELYKTNCDLINKFKENEKVIVDFNVNGRKWVNQQGEEKFFNTLLAWKITPDTTEE